MRQHHVHPPREARPSRSRLRASTLTALATAVVAAIGSTMLAAAPASAADVDVIAVDFARTTGEFRGGASGMLYGLSDEGVPTDAIIAGARPLNVTQKAPHGAQHPNGDPLEVEDAFFRNGGEYLMVNIQDYYPDWSYNGGRRPADFNTYLDIVRTVVTSIVEESAYPERYVFVPFNEPDGGNWYGNWATMKAAFLQDWKAAYETIKQVYPEARIAGMGDTGWRGDRTREILAFAVQHDVVPDMFTWHELGIDNLATFRSHLDAYRQIERDLGIEPLPVNITEYAMRRDMSVPGQLVQWLSMFEDEKVDAQTAYWTYAGNLNDNMAKSNAANGAWWLLKWYGDLTGDTVELTPPGLNVVDTVQGIATLDASKPQATVLFGGGGRDVQLDLAGLDPAVFGDTVDIQVRETEWTGQEGEAQAPRVVVAERASLVDGALDVTVPNDDRLSAYQVVVTPALAEQPVIDSTWRATVEAENTALRDVVAYTQSMGDAWTFAASNQRDVGSTNKATSALTWTVEVPTTGTYRFGVTAGVNGPALGPGSHALFVDGTHAATVNYEAGFAWNYRGRAETLVSLEAGTHELSLRMSQDGVTRLPGSDISLDKFDLTRVDGPDATTYPANLARLSGGVVAYRADAPDGSVQLSGDDTATFYVSARETGYVDLAVAYRSGGAATLGLELNGRAISGLATERAGTWTSTARVHVEAGINEVVVGSAEGIELSALTSTRAADGDTAVTRIEMEDAAAVSLSGGARVESVSQPTNVSGTQVGWLGGSAGGIAQVQRPSGVHAGSYNLVVRYANAERNTGHAYNTDVITRFLDVTEAGGETTRGAFRHNYSWKGFWTHTMPLELASDAGGLTLGNATGSAPNLDWIAFAPLVLDVSTSGEPSATVTGIEVTAAPTRTSYTVGDAFEPAGLEVSARYSDDTVIALEPGAYELSGFDASEPGERTITVSAVVDGQALTATFTVVVSAVPDGATAPPAKAKLSAKDVKDGDFRITMTLKKGENASLYQLYENGVLVATQELASASPDPQEAVVDIRGLGNGVHEYVGVLSNSKGSTSTAPFTVTVKK